MVKKKIIKTKSRKRKNTLENLKPGIYNATISKVVGNQVHFSIEGNEFKVTPWDKYILDKNNDIISSRSEPRNYYRDCFNDNPDR